jgi:hypothetical protein
VIVNGFVDDFLRLINIYLVMFTSIDHVESAVRNGWLSSVESYT